MASSRYPTGRRISPGVSLTTVARRASQVNSVGNRGKPDLLRPPPGNRVPDDHRQCGAPGACARLRRSQLQAGVLGASARTGRQRHRKLSHRGWSPTRHSLPGEGNRTGPFDRIDSTAIDPDMPDSRPFGAGFLFDPLQMVGRITPERVLFQGTMTGIVRVSRLAS